MEYNITIYSPKSIPFGLLSNHARVPMRLNNQTWTTVTGYVYGNVLETKEYAKAISSFGESFLIDAYSTSNRVISSIRQRTYSNAVIEGTMLKLEQYPTFAKKFQSENYGKRILFQHRFRSKTLKLMGDYLTNKLNKLDYVDDKYGLVSHQEIYDVIATAERNSSKITSTSTYEDLRNVKPRLNGNATILSKKYFNASSIPSLDQLARMLVLKFNELIYGTASTKNAFKIKLLHAYLESLLERNYPEIAFVDYPLAKQQQLAKLSAIEQTNLLDSVYALYEKDAVPNAVLSKMEAQGPPISDVEIRETNLINLNAEKSQSTSTNQEWLEKIVVLDNTHEIHPSYSKPIRDPDSGITFPTVVHFAYYKVGKALRIPDYAVDSTIPVDSIAQWYADVEKVFITNRIVKLNDEALGAKFKSDITVANILVRTGENVTLSWGDDNDPVLGKSSNVTGRWMMRNKQVIKEYLVRSRPDNNLPVRDPMMYAVFRLWISNKAREYSNVLRLVQNLNLVKTAPTPLTMLKLYNLDKGVAATSTITERNPVGEEHVLLVNSGVKAGNMSLIWTLISIEWNDRYRDRALSKSTELYIDDFYFPPRKLRPLISIEQELKRAVESIYDELGWFKESVKSKKKRQQEREERVENEEDEEEDGDNDYEIKKRNEFVNSFIRWPGNSLALFKAKLWNVDLYEEPDL